MFSFLENCRFVNALPPVADAFDTLVYPAGINLAQYGRLCFIVQKGVGTTGTSTIQVVAGDDSSPLNESAVAFKYRKISSNNTTVGAVTAATSSGFATTAGSSDMYIIEIDAKALVASGYKYAHLKMTEVTNSPVVGSVLAVASQPRFADHDSDLVS